MPEFAPVEVVDRSKEKDWAYKLGLLDWDDTKIVFTKRSLIDFLKYVDVTVDTNFSQISKLPRYVEFGKMTGESSSAPTEAETSAPQAAPERAPADPSDPSWKPTRRVRAVPGGAQSFHFGDDERMPGAIAAAPAAAPAPVAAAQASAPVAAPAQAPEPTSGTNRVVDNDGNPFKPTRRVRTAPGGKDSIGALFGGE